MLYNVKKRRGGAIPAPLLRVIRRQYLLHDTAVFSHLLDGHPREQIGMDVLYVCGFKVALKRIHYRIRRSMAGMQRMYRAHRLIGRRRLHLLVR